MNAIFIIITSIPLIIQKNYSMYSLIIKDIAFLFCLVNEQEYSLIDRHKLIRKYHTRTMKVELLLKMIQTSSEAGEGVQEESREVDLGPIILLLLINSQPYPTI